MRTISLRFSHKWRRRSTISFATYQLQKQIQIQVLKLYSLINGHSNPELWFGPIPKQKSYSNNAAGKSSVQ